MADNKRNEPQSYGSNAEWVTGKTGQQVNNAKSSPPAEHADFYENRRESETNGPHQGGHVAAERDADPAICEVAGDEHTPVQKVTDKESGAKRDSYFKKRDY